MLQRRSKARSLGRRRRAGEGSKTWSGRHNESKGADCLTGGEFRAGGSAGFSLLDGATPYIPYICNT
eukprot:448713-Pleurochrysis_carterae.AAC.1